MLSYKFFRKIAIAIILSSFCLSCQESIQKEIDQNLQQKSAEKKAEPNVSYGDLVIKEQSDYLLIPVTLSSDKNQSRENIFDSSSSYEKRDSIHNIIFYRKQNGETSLLLNKKAIITSFDFLEKKEKDKPPIRFWLYKIINTDTTKDKKLNEEDASIGYLSDISGKNLQQITPNNTQMLSWNVVSSINAIFIKIIKDSDSDKKFTSRDKTTFIKVNLDKPGIGTEIINEQLEQEIKSIIGK